MTITVLFRTVIDTYANDQVRMFTIPWLDELNSDIAGHKKHPWLKSFRTIGIVRSSINRFIDAELDRVHVVGELPDCMSIYEEVDNGRVLIQLRIPFDKLRPRSCPLCGTTDEYNNRNESITFRCCDIIDYHDTPESTPETHLARRSAYHVVKLICEIHGIARSNINAIILEMLGEETDPPVLHRLSESKAKRAYILAPEAVKEFIRRVQEKNRLFEQGRLSEFL